MLEHLNLLPELEKVLAAEDQHAPIWVVGGALRDHLVGRIPHDIDFVTTGNAIALARVVADSLGADIYVLDAERGAARVLLNISTGTRCLYDFSELRGDTLEADLRARDFTINALAVRFSNPTELVDPCGGLQHIKDGIVSLCADDALERDPVRALRAVRLASEFKFRLSPELIIQIRKKPSLEAVSAERVRDELFRLFIARSPGTALQLMLELDYLENVFAAHSQRENVTRYLTNKTSILRAIHVLKNLEHVMDLLSRDPDLEVAAQATLGLLTWSLGRFRDGIDSFLNQEISYGRRAKSLIMLSTFVTAGSVFPQNQESEHIAWDQHIARLRTTVSALTDQFHLSREELDFMISWLEGLSILDRSGKQHTSALYSHRFFRVAGEAGIGVVLSSLAFELSHQVEPPSTENWAAKVQLSRSLCEAWFDAYARIVEPVPLINGKDIMRERDLSPGPEVGQVLGCMLEAQVSGEITSREEALRFVRDLNLD